MCYLECHHKNLQNRCAEESCRMDLHSYAKCEVNSETLYNNWRYRNQLKCFISKLKEKIDGNTNSVIFV